MGLVVHDRDVTSLNLSDSCIAPPSEKNSAPASIEAGRKGVLKHSEHLADLVLDITPGASTGEFPALNQYLGLVERLVSQVKDKEISVLNEKFDGSPAMLLGFDASDKPFVAYKGGLGRISRDPLLIRNLAEAREAYKPGGMRTLMEDCIRELRRRIGKFEDRGLVFQVDLLFTPNNGAREVGPKAITIQANPFGIEYTIPASSKFYPFARDAKVGLVVHSVGRRVIDPEKGEVTDMVAFDDVDAIESFVKAIRSPEVFVIDPWTRRVRVNEGNQVSFSEEKEAEAKRMLHDLREGLRNLSPEFREAWSYFHPRFKQFFNTSLKAGRKGGIYLAASRQEHFDFDQIIEKFTRWASRQSQTLRVSKSGAKTYAQPRKLPGVFQEFCRSHRSELYLLMKAYYDANRVQYLLKPHMEAAYTSKLGGGSIEGIILSNDETVAKLVDRLEFTRKNFSGERTRRSAFRSRVRENSKRRSARRATYPVPEPLKGWHQGDAYYILKGQPPHVGHIAMLHEARKLHSDGKLHVIVSDKAFDPDGGDWRELCLADRKRDLKAQDYRYPFDPELRRELVEYGLPEGVEVHIGSTGKFWKMIRAAKNRNRRGEISFIVGQKEIDEGRYKHQFGLYADHLRPLAVPLQEDGISATLVRSAVKSLALQGDMNSYEFLRKAFDFIPSKIRDKVIGRVVHQWNRADAIARSILE